MLRYPQIASSIANFAKKNPGGSAPLAPAGAAPLDPAGGCAPRPLPSARFARREQCPSKIQTKEHHQTQDPQTYQLLLSPGSPQM